MKKKNFVFMIIMLIFSVVLVACSTNENATNKTENTKDDIFNYKTEYVGDNSKVIGVVTHQKYPEGILYDSIKIKSDSEPYKLSVFVSGEKKVSEDNFFKNAVATFALIGNLGEVEYIDKETNESLESFTREEVEGNLMLKSDLSPKTLKEIGESSETINAYLGN